MDHSIFRAFNKGAVGTLNVIGDANLAIFSGKQNDATFSGAPVANTPVAIPTAPVAANATPAGVPDSKSLAGKQMELGKAVYGQTCFVCHQPNGRGVANQIPPLAGSDFLLNNKTEVIRTVIQGRTGEVVVNGKKYTGIMIPQGNLSDEQIADVLTYVRNSWGNTGSSVTPDEVHALRDKALTFLNKPNSFE